MLLSVLPVIPRTSSLPSDIHSLNPRLPVPLDSRRVIPRAPVRIRQAPGVHEALRALADAVAPRERPHHPADAVPQREVSDTPLQQVIIQARRLRMSELGEYHGRQPGCRRTIPGERAAGGVGRDPERVEPVAVEPGLDDVAGARVDVLAAAVEVQLPDDLVRPGVRREVEDDGVAAVGVADGGALVAGGREEVRARRQGGQVLVVLHAAPRDEQAVVRRVDRVRAGRHVAREGGPVVVEVRAVPALAEFVAQGHGDDVRVLLRPRRDVREAAEPALHGEGDVFEPRVAVDVTAAPLGLAHVYVGVDENALLECCACDVRPDLETGRLRGPAGILRYDGLCDSRPVC